MNHGETDEIRRFHNWINDNLISLVLVYRHLDAHGNVLGEPKVAACSGFVMAFAEAWFLVSAGHVLKELDELVAHQRVRVIESFIVDSFGTGSRFNDTIPFSYADSARHSTYQDGLDYGIVFLHPNARQLLEANGRCPIAIENWINQDIDRCKAFALLGIPAELVKPANEHGQMKVSIETVIASVKRLRELPEGADETVHERFIGEISPKVDLKSLVGLSGGPIIGFFEHEGQHYYWVVALQSKALYKRFVFGCPVKLFATHILEAIMRIRQSHGGYEQ